MFNVHPVLLSSLEIEYLKGRPSVNENHDDDGHHIHNKPLKLDWVADRFASLFRNAHLRVDPQMKLYVLREGGGEVAPHVDPDYEINGFVARRSLLIHLNDDYEGGETYFGAHRAPKIPTGAAISFSHADIHSGAKVTRGTKYVLKTDIFSLVGNMVPA